VWASRFRSESSVSLDSAVYQLCLAEASGPLLSVHPLARTPNAVKSKNVVTRLIIPIRTIDPSAIGLNLIESRQELLLLRR
jgi:hypothetical protein